MNDETLEQFAITGDQEATSKRPLSGKLWRPVSITETAAAVILWVWEEPALRVSTWPLSPRES